MGEGASRAPKRVHLESAARQNDPAAISELAAAPPLPPLAAHVWRYFVDLSQTRGGGGFGPAGLTRLEIQAWERDEGIRLEPWERRAIIDLDAAWLTCQAEAIAESQAAAGRQK